MLPISSEFSSKLNDTSRTIRQKVDVYDTWFAHPSNGIRFKMYNWTDTTTDPTWNSDDQILPTYVDASSYGYIPNLQLSWGTGSPFYMPIEDETYGFAIEFSGYFYNNSATTTFYFAGTNLEYEFDFDGSTEGSGTINTRESNAYTEVDLSGLSTSTWYSFSIKIWGKTGYTDGGFVTLFGTTGGSTKVPLNAGVCNSTNSFLSANTVSGVVEIEGGKSVNEPTTYSFKVPYGSDGYELDSDNAYTYGSASLREGKLVKIFAGYELSSAPTAANTIGDVVTGPPAIEYIPRASVFIENFDIDYKNNILTVNCRDFTSLMDYSLCLNYPDAISYWTHGYFSDQEPRQPDGVNRPICFDRWGVVETIRELAYRSGLPASLTYGSEYRKDQGTTVVSTTNLMFDNGYILTASVGYGEANPEEYNYKFDIGTRIYEAIMKIVDTYGYRFEFREDGYMRMVPTNNATSKLDSWSDRDSHNNATQEDDLYSIRGTVARLNAASDEIVYSFSGTGVKVVVVRSTSAGANDNNDGEYWSGTASVQFEIRDSGSTLVDTVDANLYFPETWHYRDGNHPNFGHNVCVIDVASNLDYDDYTLTVNPASTYTIDIEEVWSYNYNYDSISRTLKTYRDSGEIAKINRLDYSRGISDLRNDVLVVGQRNGVWVPTGNYQTENIGNNPVYTNHHSRSVDIEAIVNPAATNYTGRHLTTYIQEKTINSKERAQWLSSSVLNSYRIIHNKPDFTVVGEADLELGDCIALLDKVEESGVNKYWIESFTETIRQDSWDVECGVVGVEPYPSYEENEDFNIEEYEDQYAVDFSITDTDGNARGDQEVSHYLTSDANTSHTSLSLNSSAGLGSSGYIIVYSKIYPSYGKFYYTANDNNGGLTGSFVSYNFSGTIATSGEDNSGIIYGYNPYEAEDTETYMQISFKCMVRGRIKLGVRSTGASYWVAGLSNNNGLDKDSPEPQWEEVYPGEIKTYIWDGVDQVGDTHTGDIKPGANFFAADGEYYFYFYYASYNENDLKIYNTQYETIGSDGTTSDGVLMYLQKTIADKFEMSITHSRQEIVDYTTGGNGLLVEYPGTYPQSESIRNYVYTINDQVTGKDIGRIPINFNASYLAINRNYFINITTTLYKVLGYHWYGNQFFRIRGVQKQVGVESKNILDNGAAVVFNSSDAYEFVYYPKDYKYGPLSADADFEEELADTSGNAQFEAYAYFLIVEFELFDASGRRIQMVDDSGDQILPKVGKINNKQIWSRLSEEGDQEVSACCEFFWIPEQIDTNLTSNLKWLTLGIDKQQNQPWFEMYPANGQYYNAETFGYPFCFLVNYSGGGI